MAGTNTLELTEASFQSEVLSAAEPVLVDFWANWCPPCKALGPTIDELADQYVGRAKVGKVDTDSNQALAAQYGVTTIPTVILFQAGEIRETLVGLRSKKEFQRVLDALLAE